ncbi:MAG: TonB-dependent receptor, partial [Candidatus Omnitrophica bacterium]|nr:TonB-dependent receptor [Candidatus Omnitrophota bacterium]
QGNYDICSWDKIILGFDYLREAGESRWDSLWGLSLSPKELSNTKGYYIENILTPMDNLFFSASFRLEDHSRYKSHNTFSVSGSYLFKETGTKIKASFGEGFKAPSLYQLFDGNFGNPDLNPEESESYEVGFEQSLGRNLKLGSTYFHTHIKNLIEWLPAGYDNTGKSRIYGIEVFSRYSFTPETAFKIAYTHMDTEKLSDKSRLLRRPDNKLTATLTAELNKVKLNLDISYVGNRMDTAATKLKSYLLADFSLNYKLSEKIEAFLRLENLLDRDYELVNGYQTPEFSAYLGTKIKF